MTLSLRLKRLAGWMLLILISAVLGCSSNSPPGKPVFKECHSPDKETFTCQWEPGANDSEDTTYRLFYETERTNGIFECPDYHTAGKNSCFFDRNHTSIWVFYFLTVVAINNYGNTSSDLYKIDVAHIIKSHPPENVTLQLELSEDIPNVHIFWNPVNADNNFGWITVKYEVRFKKEDTEWQTKNAGGQTRFSLYSVSPGKLYMVQVRCMVDNIRWSEWSKTTSIQVLKPESKRHIWILVAFFSAIPFFAALCIMFIKRKIIKQWLLPPVPGPKIKGVDVQLLKNGRSEEVTSALLVHQVFLSGKLCKNQSEEYLVVYDDHMQLIEDQKHTNQMISNNCHSKSSINNQLNVLDNVESKEEVTILDYLVDSSRSTLINELNRVNTMETEKALYDKIAIANVKPVENSSYVDIQRQEVEIRPSDYSTAKENTTFLEKQSSNNKVTDRPEEHLPDDYTRVKEVNSDNMVLLQDPSSRNHAQYRDCSSQKPSHPVIGKVGECAVLNNGYVDSIHTTIT